MPETSCIIYAHNGWEWTRSCLKSLAETTDKSKTEIIIVDDASTDITEKGCPFLGKQLFGDSFHYIRNHLKQDYATALYQCAETARGEFLLFLQNSIDVQQNWYEPLLQDFSQYPDLAATAPVLVSSTVTPLGRPVQHIGTVLSPLGRHVHLHRHIPCASPLAQKRRFFQMLSSVCFMVRRNLFCPTDGNTGRLIRIDDTGLCLQLSSEEYRMTVNPNSVAILMDSQLSAYDRNNISDATLEMPHIPGGMRPDWHLHVQTDGLCPTAEWKRIRCTMPRKEEDSLDAELLSMTDDRLDAALIAHPYWEKGWIERICRSRDASLQKTLLETFVHLFPTPAGLSHLLHSPEILSRDTADNRALLTFCVRHLRSFFISPLDYRNAAETLEHACREPGLSELAEQCRSFLENYDTFCGNEYTDLARDIWHAECMLGVRHSPKDPTAYRIWTYAVDTDQRKQEIRTLEETIQQHPESVPGISVLMPVYNPEPVHLREALDSVMAQTFPCWELCIADDASTDPQTPQILREYAEKDPRIRVVRRRQNGHIAAATNTALEMAGHPWVTLMDQDDLLTADALAFVVQAIVGHPHAQLIFSDEDKLGDDGLPCDPFFKSGRWDPEMIPVQNYVCHLVAYRTERLRKLHGFRDDFPGAQDHELVLRYTEGLPPESLIHIPHVLYHWRAHEKSTSRSVDAKGYARKSLQRLAALWLERQCSGAVVENLPPWIWPRIRYPMSSPLPSVSLICQISDPSGNPRFSLREYAARWQNITARSVRLIFVCHEKDFPDLSDRQPENTEQIRLLAVPDDWTPVRSLQYGAENASGEILGFVDTDTIPRSGDWFQELIPALCRQDVGAVGPKIVDRADRMVHGGYLTDVNHELQPVFVGRPQNRTSWFGWTVLARTVDALDLLCLFTRKDLFRRNDGFDCSMNELAGQEYCIRLQRNGYRSVWIPYTECLYQKIWKNPHYKNSEFHLTSGSGQTCSINENLLSQDDDWNLRS